MFNLIFIINSVIYCNTYSSLDKCIDYINSVLKMRRNFYNLSYSKEYAELDIHFFNINCDDDLANPGFKIRYDCSKNSEKITKENFYQLFEEKGFILSEENFLLK